MTVDSHQSLPKHRRQMWTVTIHFTHPSIDDGPIEMAINAPKWPPQWLKNK